MFWSISFVEFIKLDITKGFFSEKFQKCVLCATLDLENVHPICSLPTQSILSNKRL